MLGDAMVLDFEGGAAGIISGTDALFTGFGLDNVSLIGTHFISGDILNSGAFGNALVSQGNTLAIAAPFDRLDNQNAGAGYGFQLTGTATQFGFRIVDQVNHALTIETYSGGGLLDSIAYNPAGGFPIAHSYFQSDTPFDEFRVFATRASGGWGVDDLTVAGKSVPEPATLLVLATGLGALWYRRRRRRVSFEISGE